MGLGQTSHSRPPSRVFLSPYSPTLPHTRWKWDGRGRELGAEVLCLVSLPIYFFILFSILISLVGEIITFFFFSTCRTIHVLFRNNDDSLSFCAIKNLYFEMDLNGVSNGAETMFLVPIWLPRWGNNPSLDPVFCTWLGKKFSSRLRWGPFVSNLMFFFFFCAIPTR